MNKQKTILIIAAIAMGTIALMVLDKTTKVSNAVWTIGIIQTASHPALDAAREGFMQEISTLLGDQVHMVVRNAQGSVANAYTIAQSFHADKNINAIFAIATPAAQAAAAIEKEKPIILAAVTDPQALGIIHPTTNVTGTCDMINVPEQIQLIKTLAPSVKKVAVLFNVAEINSATLATAMITELEHRGLTPIKVAITNESEVIPAIEHALRNADAVLTPTDNSVACAITIIAQKSLQAKKPLFVSDNLLVQHGALAARGVDYHESGKQAARITASILLDGKKPHEIPIAHAQCSEIVINQQTLEALGLMIPETLQNNITRISP